MIRLTRRYRFSASHRLHTPELSDRENAELYGRCNNPLGHGHDYVLEITVSGAVEDQTGRVADRRSLDGLVESAVLERLRHRNLNTEVRDIAGPIPTTENIAAGIWTRLRQAWPDAFPGIGPKLESVRVYETPRNVVEVPVHT